ncbi:recombinase family protein [Alicyclobacillus cycloheptanicus]|nr:recombinase family protein [Alicyclobacillus cycloheptanicus]
MVTGQTVPPLFPINSEARSLDIDSEKLEIYNYIKQRILNGATCGAVCWELNRRGIPSPKGKLWSESVLYRLILNEVHLGRVVYGKTSGGLHKKRKAAPFKVIPRENWIVVESAHPAVKTPEEHAEIITLLESRRIQPKHARRGTYVLSGLLFCGKCGYSLQFQRKENGRTLEVPENRRVRQSLWQSWHRTRACGNGRHGKPAKARSGTFERTSKG